ncbi:MAG: tripartite tricarboxylate transporter substrate binding protein [Betaproteobacteria bacterium]|nr:tripartite tricarboxylate transporter substrate binding protein [Betaproteobacteria bacterium]
MKIGNRLLPQWCTVFSLVVCASIAGAALAQPYPDKDKQIRMIVASVPGGATDRAARMIGQSFTEAWGQLAIFDYRGGAGGNIAFEVAAKAPPDGYALLVMSTSFLINPSLYSKLPFDTIKDFAPITQYTAQVYYLVVHPTVPAKTVKELIALAKSKKGGITYASSGTGQAGHLGMELLKTRGGFEGVHVPYKGASPAMVDLMAGQVDAYLTSQAGLSYVKAGKMKALAVTGLKRSVFMPDLPTVAESGFPGFEVTGLQGLVAPAGTPRAIVAKLYEVISKSLKLPAFRDRLVADGSEPVGSTPEEFAAYIKADTIKWAKVVKQSGAKVN